MGIPPFSIRKIQFYQLKINRFRINPNLFHEADPTSGGTFSPCFDRLPRQKLPPLWLAYNLRGRARGICSESSSRNDIPFGRGGITGEKKEGLDVR